MDGELLSLKWNNHRTTFYHVISGLRNKESYTDVTLACDGKFYPVHKLVLSTCSEYFSDIFERTNCKNPVVILKDIQCSDLEFLLDYMYIGEVNVRQNELASLIKAAECLRVKGLAVPDEEPKKISSSSGSSRQRPEQQSPPSKRRRTEERRNTDHSPGRPPDTRRGSSSSVNSEIRDTNPARDVNPSQRSDDPPSRRDRNSSSDQNAGTPVQQIKLEKDEDEQEIYTIQSNSFDGGGDGPDTEGDSATEFPEFLQSSIEKEEPMSMSDYNPSDFPGPSGMQNSGVPPWDGDSSGFTESLSGAVAAAVAAAQQPGQQQQQQQQLSRGLSAVGSSFHMVRALQEAFLEKDLLATAAASRLRLGTNASISVPHLNIAPRTERLTSPPLKSPTIRSPTGIRVSQDVFKNTTIGGASSQDASQSAGNSNSGTGNCDENLTCPFCGRLCKRRDHLRLHIRTHTGEKPFQCPYCDRRTNQKNNLKLHMRNVHPEKFISGNVPNMSNQDNMEALNLHTRLPPPPNNPIYLGIGSVAGLEIGRTSPYRPPPGDNESSGETHQSQLRTERPRADSSEALLSSASPIAAQTKDMNKYDT